MYDTVPCDNEEYGKFLKGVYSGRNASEENDPEEFREDKDTDVAKEELVELMEDLQVFADTKMRRVIKKKKVLETIQDLGEDGDVKVATKETEEVSVENKENVEI